MYRSVSQSDESIRGDAQTLFLCCDDQTLRIFLILMNQHASPVTHVLPVVLSHTSKSIELTLSTYWLLWSLNENEYCPGCHTMTAWDNYSTCVGKHTSVWRRWRLKLRLCLMHQLLRTAIMTSTQRCNLLYLSFTYCCLPLNDRRHCWEKYMLHGCNSNRRGDIKELCHSSTATIIGLSTLFCRQSHIFLLVEQSQHSFCDNWESNW